MFVLFRLLVILVISTSCDSDLQIEADLNSADTETLDEKSNLFENVSIDPKDICNDVTFINQSGESQKGKRDCTIAIADRNCTLSGENNCFIGIEGSFLADDDLKPTNFKSGLVVGNITGTLVPKPGDCNTNAETGCVTTSTYKAADFTNIIAENIKSGVTAAGVSGNYPSASNPLTGNTAAADLTAATMNAKLASTTAFEFFDSAGNLHSSAGDADLIANNIETGNTIFGVAGSVTASPTDCSSNTEVGCVTTATYKAADLTNLTSGNIKNGVSIAGQAGSYPSGSNPLTGNTAAADLTAATMNTKLASATAFEFFDSAGNLQSSAGDADLTAGNIQSGNTIFGVAGSVTPSPADCSSNTEIGCVTTATYKAADLTNLTAGNIKNGVSIAGQAGDYPSATNPLTGNTAAADLTAAIMNAQLASATAFEFFDSAGNLQSSAGDANLTAGNIQSGNTIFGVAGSVTPSPSDCSSNGEQSCVTTATYKAADLTNLTAGNIKNGVTIAGQGGNYPSASSPLAGNTGTTDLTSATMNAQLATATAFEFFDSAGNLQSSAGDADLAAGNIKNSITILGISGSVLESPVNCSSDGETGCVAVTAYKAAEMSNVTAGSVKSGTTIAGVSGNYPSSTYPLPGASGDADLTLFNTQITADGNFEYWDSAGTRRTGSGDSDISAINIKSSTIFENLSITGTLQPEESLPFKAISTGFVVSCAIASDNKAYCWGGGDAGQLGNGLNAHSNVPVEVSGGIRFKSITAGANTVCGLAINGNAYCWGGGDYGRIGNGLLSDQNTPTLVSGGHKFIKISGQEHFCGLTSSGSVYCWGYNGFGQLGNGNTTNQHVPALVSGGHTFKDLDLGRSHTCALKSSGESYCWGGNHYGGIGNNSLTSSSVPIATNGGHKFTSIAVSWGSSCGVNSNGEVYCWGWGEKGQMGNGTNTINNTTPIKIPGTQEFLALTASYQHFCGIEKDGDAFCWGGGDYGQIGNGSNSDQNTPTAISNSLKLEGISSGTWHTCGFQSTGKAYCWGRNISGGVGDNTYTPRNTPVPVAQ